MEPTCESCLFWKKEKWIQFGGCQRHAPHADPVLRIPGTNYIQDHEPRALWPKTRNDDYCGDYEQRPDDAVDGDGEKSA